MKITKRFSDTARDTAAQIKKALGFSSAHIGLILGTGFGDVLPFKETDRLSLKKIHGFGKLSDLTGHKRELILGKSKKRKNILALSGRIHLYEGFEQDVLPMVRLQTEMLCHLGVKKLIVTSAVGRLNKNIPVGSLVVIEDLITSYSPSVLMGEEFVPYNAAIDKKLNNTIFKISRQHYDGITAYGRHVMLKGPGFETMADKKLLELTADVVGMSMLPEISIASLYGIKAVGLCFVTNDELEHSHEQNLRRGHDQAPALNKVLTEILKKL